MKISRKTWNNYITLLRKINDKAAEELERWIEIYGADNGITDLSQIRDDDGNNLIDAAYLTVVKYGDASAAVSAQMYDSLAELSGVNVEPAEMAANPEYGEVAKTVQGVLKTSQNVREVSGAVSRLVKRTGADTTLRNAARDGAQFAWIPSGDTCPFCLMLASNGWQYMSKNALKNGHAEHIHSNCDCTYAIRFDRNTQVAGYDPDVYREMYYSAEGNTPNERINSMRRAQYAKNKDEINAQKRMAYAERNGLNNAAQTARINIQDKDLPLSSKNMFNNLDALHERADAVEPLKGYDDVFIHGNAYGVCYKDADGKETNIPNEVFVELLKSFDLNEKGLRLCACDAGAATNGVAQYVADALGKEVLAPSKTLWLSPINKETNISTMTIASETKLGMPNYDDMGTWVTFYPKKEKK